MDLVKRTKMASGDFFGGSMSGFVKITKIIRISKLPTLICAQSYGKVVSLGLLPKLIWMMRVLRWL